MLYDVLVVGAGPAGTALAVELCRQGLDVLCLAPGAPPQPWPNTYGMWEQEARALGIEDLFARRWDNPACCVFERSLPLGRAYGLLDNPRLQAHLLQRGAGGRLAWQSGEAARVEHFPAFTRLTTRQGQEAAARLVVDASGHSPALLWRPAARPPAYQAAFGLVGSFSAPPVPPGGMALMDYRSPHLSPAEAAGPPTFLYAMDLGQGQYFVEETSLAHSPALSFELLQARLLRRLAAGGVQPREIRHTERVLFPMDLPLPGLRQRVLGFGGAASMVHPASGYLVGGALRRAPRLAQVIAGELGNSGASPARAARRAWQALWPAAARRRRALYLLGLRSLLGFDLPTTQAFFQAFFELPQALWSGYLSDTHSEAQILQTMLALFAAAPPGLRRRLLGTALRR